MNHFSNKTANLVHLCFFHSASSNRRCSNTQARGNKWFVLIEWNRVFVDCNQRSFQCLLSVLTGNTLAGHPDVNQHQVIVGTTRDESESLLL